MDADRAILSFNHVDHLLLGRPVVDTRSMHEGELKAVVIEDGREVGYVLGKDRREFPVPMMHVRAQ
ncbi:hypothetical protein [Streptomyces sp. NRRL S-87]|uniref:hypothetical protein n=1 Tax=Streptomyces sp. NRRL S-87 TaxID=1463920 RepID=UPI0004C15D51|nr:hypothetical protein [Streptomyces sp. NRRL S-87]